MPGLETDSAQLFSGVKSMPKFTPKAKPKLSPKNWLLKARSLVLSKIVWAKENGFPLYEAENRKKLAAIERLLGV